MPKQRMFPVMDHRGRRFTERTIYVPWWLAEAAYIVYARDYGGSGQSLERVAARGGFSDGELDMFVPGWRKLYPSDE